MTTSNKRMLRTSRAQSDSSVTDRARRLLEAKHRRFVGSNLERRPLQRRSLAGLPYLGERPWGLFTKALQTKERARNEFCSRTRCATVNDSGVRKKGKHWKNRSPSKTRGTTAQTGPRTCNDDLSAVLVPQLLRGLEKPVQLLGMEVLPRFTPCL